MYQLNAYRHKSLRDEKQISLVLIYFKTENFNTPLPVFKYENGLTLKVVPFDLDAGELVGLGSFAKSPHNNID